MEKYENEYSFDPMILKALTEQRPNFLTELLRFGMNEAMKVEREQFLNAAAQTFKDFNKAMSQFAADNEHKVLQSFPKGLQQKTVSLYAPKVPKKQCDG